SVAHNAWYIVGMVGSRRTMPRREPGPARRYKRSCGSYGNIPGRHCSKPPWRCRSPSPRPPARNTRGSLGRVSWHILLPIGFANGGLSSAPARTGEHHETAYLLRRTRGPRRTTSLILNGLNLPIKRCGRIQIGKIRTRLLQLVGSAKSVALGFRV